MSDFSMLTGSILIGTQLNWALLGTLTLQVYIFHVSFPTERAPIKALVYTIFLLDVLQSAPSSHFAFEVLATGWGNPEALQKLPWTNAAIPVITGMVSAPVQIFFAWRIYNLRKDSRYTIVVCGLIITLALLQSSTGMAGGIKFALLTQVPSGKSDVLLILLQIWLIGSVACDVIIAVTMIIILTQYRKATPWKNTDSLITKLISHTIQTGALTSIVVILDLALFFAYSSSYFPGIPIVLPFPVAHITRNTETHNAYVGFWWLSKFAYGTDVPNGEYHLRFAALVPFENPKLSEDWKTNMPQFITVNRTVSG
ncbi:hypothetical protein DFH09DRAFT_1368508 [Mycena vulgaris]|nr:hypothetical protein DFH09DRAFT_1368508 [Mycena vulgaris]